MNKKANKYTSADIQNECLYLMALHIPQHISDEISRIGHYTIMADMSTDVANQNSYNRC